MVAQSTRLKWKTDTCSVLLADGVYLRGNNSRLILKGKSLYRLLERLAPTLNGEVTLAEITEGLDAERTRMVTNLLEKLAAHHFLNDTSQDQLHGLDQAELETYAPDLAFIESFQTSAARRFECFRNQRLLLISSGAGLTSLLQAGLQGGMKQLNALLTPEDESGPSSPPDALSAYAEAVSTEHVRFIDLATWDDEAGVREIIQAYDAVLHLAEWPALARARLLNRVCLEQQKTLIQAVIVDNHAWVGPLVCPETSICWECAWRRLQANLQDRPASLACYELADQPSTSPDLSPAAATVVANQLFFALFQHVTRISTAEAAGRLTAIDLRTLLGESHAFLPHPHCQAGHVAQHVDEFSQPSSETGQYSPVQFLTQIRRLRQRDPIDPDLFLERVMGCVDKRCGLFSANEHEHFVQVPLAVYRMQLSNPMRLQHASASLSVTAVGSDPKSASIRVAQKACEGYAASFVDQRRLLAPETAMQGAIPAIQAGQLIGHEPYFPDGERWTWALDLHTQQAAFVPAGAVFNQHQRGVASGMSWAEALCRALLDWCNMLTVEQLREGAQPYAQVDLEGALLTPEDRHLARLLRAVGPLTVYDVTGPLRVPTFAVCLDERVVVYSTHCDAARALRIGLEQALQQYQSEHFQQDAYAVGAVPDLPMYLRGSHPTLPSYALPEAWPDRLAWLLQRWRASGLQALAVPLDHDPALAQLYPFIARILVISSPVESWLQKGPGGYALPGADEARGAPRENHSFNKCDMSSGELQKGE